MANSKIVSRYGIERDNLVSHLENLNYNDSVSYSDLSRVSGINILSHRHVLGSARKVLLKTKQMVFEPVRSFGLRRITEDQIAELGLSVVKKTRRVARKGIAVVSAGDYSLMSDSGKVRQSVGLTVLNMIQHAGASSTLRKIEGAVINAGQRLPLAETLKQLG